MALLCCHSIRLWTLWKWKLLKHRVKFKMSCNSNLPIFCPTRKRVAVRRKSVWYSHPPPSAIHVQRFTLRLLHLPTATLKIGYGRSLEENKGPLRSLGDQSTFVDPACPLAGQSIEILAENSNQVYLLWEQ